MRLWCKRAFAVAAVANAVLLAYLQLASHRSASTHPILSVNPVSYSANDDVAIVEDPEDSLAISTDFAAAIGRQLVQKMRAMLPQTGDEASCSRLLAGDAAEQTRALGISQARPVPLDYRSDEFFAAQPCAAIRQRFITESVSWEEASFPVAFSLVVFKDFFQVEKLFRAVYRPEHFYCFHVDIKAHNAFYQAVAQYASCFGNVALATRRLDVVWGRYSVLEAELLCMERLLKLSRKWRYLINLTGQEFPLRTMLELVRILRALNGANNMENAGPRNTMRQLEVTLQDGSIVPIQWYKGSVHIAATRGFVEFALSPTGRQISDHVRKYARWPCPDEVFFATLNNNPKVLRVPGADKSGLQTDNVKQPFLNRYKNWIFGVFGYPCLSQKIIRQVCIWGIRDLPAMDKRFELFVNKFYFNFQRFGLQCMEERFWNNTMADYNVTGYRKTHQIPLHFYENFEFVRNHI